MPNKTYIKKNARYIGKKIFNAVLSLIESVWVVSTMIGATIYICKHKVGEQPHSLFLTTSYYMWMGLIAIAVAVVFIALG